MRARLAAGTWLLSAALLLGGCSKESADEGTDGCRVEITPRSGLPVSVSAQGTLTRSTADPLQEMDMWFARSDERSAGVWGAYGTAALKAVRTGGSGEQPLTFDPSQYYQTNGLKTRMAGWYPGGATAVGDASGKGYYDAAAGTVSWSIDGSRDILTAPLGTGSKTEAMPVIEFGHALAQVQVYVYADPGVSAQWGQLRSVQLLDQNAVCTLKLSGVTEASAPVGGTDGGKTPFALANATPLEIPEGKDNAVAFGDPVMIVPQDSKNYQLKLQLSAGAHRPKQAFAPGRAYLAGAQGLRQISRDHSLVEDMVEKGDLTPGQARSHPRRNLITRALGPDPAVEADDFAIQWKAGDFLLLCSDGLVNTVTDQEIMFEILHNGQPEDCLQRLMAISKQRGAPDNVTAILLMND